MENNEHIKKAYIDKIYLGEGAANIEIALDDNLFYKILSETTGMNIEGEYQLISTIKVLAEAKKEFDKIKYALEEVKRKGYGIVTPVLEEMKLEDPVIVKHGSKFGVKLRASAPSIHLIKADIETEISPIVGTEKQSEDLINYLNEEMSEDPAKIWELNMFGKSMHDLVKDGLSSKLFRMPEDAQMKLQETLQKIINEGSGGLICIIL
jgi:stage IV sporulation protein A